MDTKWKKSKMMVSAVSYAAGISLLIAAVMFNPYLAFRGNLRDLKVITSSEGSYEETGSFRDYVSEMLNDLIRVGAGKPIYNNATEYVQIEDYGSAANFWSLGATGTIVVSTATASAEEVVEEAEESVSWWQGSAQKAAAAAEEFSTDQEASYAQIEDAQEEWSEQKIEKARNEFLNTHFEDKNLLYEVVTTDSAGKEVTYRNAEQVDLKADASALLDQYSFVLRFDGEKASAWLEGRELDLYGDGVYLWDSSQWAIPGYENYKLSEDWNCGQITIAVRRVPMRYTVDGTVYGNRLYWIQRNLQIRQHFFHIWIGLSVCAAAALALSIYLRKPRRDAVKKLGGILGQIPFEIAALLTAGLLYAGYMLYIYNVFWGDSSNWLTQWGIALLLFWTVWLAYVYFRYGSKPWKNSLLGRFIRMCRKKEFKLDIQERVMGRAIRPLYFLIAAIGLGIGGYLLWSFYRWDYRSYPAAAAAEFIGIGLMTAAGLSLFTAAVLLFYNGRCQCRLAADLGLLNEQIDTAYKGGKRDAYEMPADSDLAKMVKKVAGIQDNFEKAVEERMKSERMKVELVANVSHDIKTPLTSIISYVDILKADESLPEELKDYVAILAQKSERLKEMVQDVFEVSKASSGQLPVQMEKLDLAKLLYQTLADMQERVEEAPVSLKVQIPEEAVEIVADGQRLYRVFQNLLQNALQYSLEGSRIYVRLEKKGSLAIASVRNTSKYELDQNTDFTERFVRGDNSRTDGGSGLGLSIAKSFTEACGGSFKVETIADLFVVTVEFETE